jgi:predicted O-linked N-acetylglucosamine transferase (SPINDLY family)
MGTANSESNLIIEKCLESGNDTQAMQFAKALSTNEPNNPYGPYWLGRVFFAQQQWESAEAAFQQALCLDAAHYPTLARLAYLKLQLCDWGNISELKTQLLSARENDFLEGKFRFVDPICVLPLALNLDIQQKIASARSDHYVLTRPKIRWNRYAALDGRLKIGYISPDLNGEGLGILIRSLFAFHDKTRYEIYGYCLRSGKNDIRTRIESGIEHYQDMAFISDFEVAKRINEDGIHILVDLSGFLPFARPRILAMQPAPIQCHLLGYPSTLGATYIQHYISSETQVLSGMQAHFSEKIQYLPNTHFATLPFPLPEGELRRESFGLPSTGFVFACLAPSYHIDPKVFKAWMEILRESVPAVLWLQSSEPQVIQNLQNEARDQGVDPMRLIFTPTEPLTHRWIHQLADVWLDTFSLSTGTDIVMALWVGLPVLSLEGALPQMRTGSSFLQAGGLSELVVSSPEEYIDTAIDLYKNPQKIDALRGRLVQNRYRSPLFHPAQYIQALERLYDTLSRSIPG